MSEVDDNWYNSGNHGHHANPETAHAKLSAFDSDFYFLTLPRRLVIKCVAAFWLGASYWFHFSLRELEPSTELLRSMASSLRAAEQ